MAAYDFPPTAGQPTDGSFEYTAPDGTLYEWNGYAWKVPPGEGGGGSGGGDFEVPTQALPPAGAVDGDMFWCTDDGRLYIYYEDVNTSQWVDASPDNTAEAVSSYWSRSGTTLSPENAGDVVSTTNAFTVKHPGGTSSGVASFVNYIDGSGNFAIYADGTAKVGGNAGSSPNITLNASGIIEAANTLKVVNASASATATLAIFGNSNNALNHGKVYINGQGLYVGNDVSDASNANITLRTDGVIISAKTWTYQAVDAGGTARPVYVENGGAFGYRPSFIET